MSLEVFLVAWPWATCVAARSASLISSLSRLKVIGFKEVVDLDEVSAWLAGDEPLDPVLLLNAWNLFWDIASGTGSSFEHRSLDLDLIYNKLFAAN